MGSPVDYPKNMSSEPLSPVRGTAAIGAPLRLELAACAEFVAPIEDDRPVGHTELRDRENRLHPGRAVAGGRIGRGAFILVVIVIMIEIAAIALANDRHWLLATALAWGVIGLTLVSFTLGIFALIRRSDRRLAIAAIVLSIASNPLVLVAVFAALGGR